MLVMCFKLVLLDKPVTVCARYLLCPLTTLVYLVGLSPSYPHYPAELTVFKSSGFTYNAYMIACAIAYNG